MANTLKGWLADNTVTTQDKTDRILVLESTGKADINKVYDDMQAEDTGLRRETIVHAVTLYNRICARLLMNGYQLNTGLFYAVPRFLGVVEGGKWNPEQNAIYVAFTQDKVLREEIQKTHVSILGEKKDVMYIIEVEDRKTKLKDGTMTPGHNFFVRGANLKVMGSNEAVGVTLTRKDGTVHKLDEDQITTNKPSELTLLLPANLTDGDYELTVTTQYVSNHVELKTPRSVSYSVHVGNGGGGDRPEIE